ncbi:MAG: hypothetical protein NZ528_12645 [Caldilineales bacterium]|nr:hypothetical protein [Caldilineales bacterium]MDW8318288.1 CARDB domain-containing protein [Anaerolineae bacterium]
MVALVLVLPGSAAADDQINERCLYPSANERFGITASYASLNGWDARRLYAGAWQNWTVTWWPNNVQGMRYYPTIHVTENGYEPERRWLEHLIPLHRSTIWFIGSEVDTVWMGNVRPETYARLYRDLYTFIKSRDRSAKIAISGFSTVSPLRMEWLNRAWNAYRQMYGTDMPVDVWNIHTYVVNEMVHEWGPQIPPGIENAVGYTEGDWERVPMPAASGGSVHASDRPEARAYFAVHGDSLTVYLRTGPDAGVADLYVDNRPQPEARVDLYAPFPGVISRTFRNLPRGDRRLADWHHVRVQVAHERNPASTGRWVRVDAAEAASTAALPGGRLEDDYPLRARILTTAEHYLDTDEMLEQLRMFRRWMADHGQRHKPLINSEFGVLLGEREGIFYPQVRDFMLRSFDLFLHHAIDPEIGYPADGNRLLQEWFWYILAGDYFDGQRIHSALMNPATRELTPLGHDFANYTQPLTTLYADLAITHAQWETAWPLFAGQPARFSLEAVVANRGINDVGLFHITLTQAGSDVTVKDWTVPQLTGREGNSYIMALEHAWQRTGPGPYTFRLTLDSAGQVDEPCDPNNVVTYTAGAPAHVDLALRRATPTLYRRLSPDGQVLADFFLNAEVVNLGSVGTRSSELPLTLWQQNPDGSLQLLDRRVLTPASWTGEPVKLAWRNAPVGRHQLVVRLEGATDDVDPTNNELALSVLVPTSTVHLPVMHRD